MWHLFWNLCRPQLKVSEYSNGQMCSMSIHSWLQLYLSQVLFFLQCFSEHVSSVLSSPCKPSCGPCYHNNTWHQCSSHIPDIPSRDMEPCRCADYLREQIKIWFNASALMIRRKARLKIQSLTRLATFQALCADRHRIHTTLSLFR